MFGLKLLSVGCLIAIAVAQDYQDFGPQPGRPQQAPHRLNSQQLEEQKPTPIPILKQINKHNEDGSYTYGYEGADGSFKIETKLATGEVKGKYGYVDETGKVRTVEYGANKYGFQPVGEGITVAPPTLVDESGIDYDDEQQQQPQYPQQKQASRISKPQSRPQYVEQPQPQRPQYFDYEQPAQPQAQPPRPKYSGSPVPPRPQIANAVPIDVVYSQRPRPARPEPEYDVRPQTFPSSQPSFIPAPQPKPKQIAYTAPRPIQQQPQPQPQPQFQQQQFSSQPRPQGRSTSVLDQLAIDYALPQGGSQALHDISFGYY